MKVVRILAIVAVVYVAIVAAFETMIGTLQPEAGSVLTITTADPDGTRHDRVVSRLESDGQLYVAANHWPRAWYERALANPDVTVTIDGETADYDAVPVSPGSEEHERVGRDNSLGLGFRILTGFPPRYFLRLEPKAGVPVAP